MSTGRARQKKREYDERNRSKLTDEEVRRVQEQDALQHKRKYDEINV
jgi:hypothetical protein